VKGKLTSQQQAAESAHSGAYRLAALWLFVIGLNSIWTHCPKSAVTEATVSWSSYLVIIESELFF
jgi:hypothetical protein